MRIITLNCNGIRAAARKGFFEWLSEQHADFVCLQETRIQPFQRTDPRFYPKGNTNCYVDAEKPGYSGVALYCRRKPDRIREGLGWADFDSEGRWIQADYGRLSVVSLYLPSGTSSDVRQDFKYDLMERLKPLLKKFAASGREYIICGDINIAHKNIDIKNWRGNQKNSGFLPEERAWIDCGSKRAVWLTFSGGWTRARSNTPGGRTAARPGPRMLVGVLTTRLALR